MISNLRREITTRKMLINGKTFGYHKLWSLIIHIYDLVVDKIRRSNMLFCAKISATTNCDNEVSPIHISDHNVSAKGRDGLPRDSKLIGDHYVVVYIFAGGCQPFWKKKKISNKFVVVDRNLIDVMAHLVSVVAGRS